MKKGGGGDGMNVRGRRMKGGEGWAVAVWWEGRCGGQVAVAFSSLHIIFPHSLNSPPLLPPLSSPLCPIPCCLPCPLLLSPVKMSLPPPPSPVPSSPPHPSPCHPLCRSPWGHWASTPAWPWIAPDHSHAAASASDPSPRGPRAERRAATPRWRTGSRRRGFTAASRGEGGTGGGGGKARFAGRWGVKNGFASGSPIPFAPLVTPAFHLSALGRRSVTATQALLTYYHRLLTNTQ